MEGVEGVGGGDGRASGLGEGGLRCALGVEEPDDREESADNFRPALGRTHPPGVARPSAVCDSSGALFGRVCFGTAEAEDFLVLVCFL